MGGRTGETTRPQHYTKGYRLLRDAESGEHGPPQGGVHPLLPDTRWPALNTDAVTLHRLSRLYLDIFMCIHVCLQHQSMKTEALNLKEQERLWGGGASRQWKGKGCTYIKFQKKQCKKKLIFKSQLSPCEHCFSSSLLHTLSVQPAYTLCIPGSPHCCSLFCLQCIHLAVPVLVYNQHFLYRTQRLVYYSHMTCRLCQLCCISYANYFI